MPRNNYTSQIIHVREGGRLTIPYQLRESLTIQEGDTLAILPVGKTLVLTPCCLHTPALMDRMADMLDGSGLSLAYLLADLPHIREEIYRERYQANHEQ